ncbi:MAG: hypothetical protein ABW066_16335 [Sedimenticola sp.]
MPIRFEAYESGNYFISCWEGRVADPELIPSYSSFLNSSDWVPGMSELIDFSGIESPDVTHFGLINLAHYVNRVYVKQEPQKAKVAVYSPRSEHTWMSVIYSAWFTGYKQQISVYRNIDEAVRWVIEQNN